MWIVKLELMVMRLSLSFFMSFFMVFIGIVLSMMRLVFFLGIEKFKRVLGYFFFSLF